MIKVLIVEDSALVRQVLTSVLGADPEIKVIGTAVSGSEGVKLALELKPDIITMDIVMPDMDGVEATKQIMAYQPTPILLLTSSYPRKIDMVFKAISYGALDVAEKINFEQGIGEEGLKEILITKIKLLSRVKVIRHPLARLERAASSFQPKRIAESQVIKGEPLKKILAIAASTGGPQAIASILSHLPKIFPWGILVVQHIARGFDQGLVDWLASCCAISVKLAENNEEIKAGTAYIAPNDFQMKLKQQGVISIINEAPCGNFKPSADVLFKSVAEVYHYNSIAVILTGMGKDGASGIKAVKDAGGKTIAQDEKTSIVFGMPKEAIDAGGIDMVLAIDKISGEIMANI